jgi:hypothetical protein
LNVSTAARAGVGQPTVQILFRNTFTVNQRYYFENVDWGVLEAGEFVHDQLAGKLYLYPPSSAHTMAILAGAGAGAGATDGFSGHVVAPTTDQLIEIRSDNVTLSNLTFTDVCRCFVCLSMILPMILTMTLPMTA